MLYCVSGDLVFKLCQCALQISSKKNDKPSCSEKCINASLKNCNENMKREIRDTYVVRS